MPWMLPAAIGGSALLGYVGSQDQLSQQRDLANQYQNMGAPYRKRLADLYNDPSSFFNSDAVKIPVQMGTDNLSRSLSLNGNPVGSGNALQQLQDYSTKQLYGQLGAEKDRLAGFGGLSAYNGAAPGMAQNAVSMSANPYNAIGYGLGSLADYFKPQSNMSYGNIWSATHSDNPGAALDFLQSGGK